MVRRSKAPTRDVFLTAEGVATRLTIRKLKQAKMDPRPLLAKAGISPLEVGEEPKRVGAESQIRFLEIAAEALDDSALSLHLAQDFITLCVLEHLGEVGAATLEPILELCSCSTCGSSLLQRGRALLVGQLGKGHDSSVSDQSFDRGRSFCLCRVLRPAETTVLTLRDEI